MRWTKKGLGGKIAGLTKEFAFLEGDKARCKQVLKDIAVPVADKWTIVDGKSYKDVLSTCLEYIHQFGGAVLKYPYSAGGKGARVILSTWEIEEVYSTLIKDYKKIIQVHVQKSNVAPFNRIPYVWS